MSNTTNATYQANPNWYSIRSRILAQGNSLSPVPVSPFLFPSLGSANFSIPAILQTNTTNSVSTSTGATVINGGIGISGNTTIGGILSVQGIVNSSSITTGTFRGTGLASIAKNLFVGGNTQIFGTVGITDLIVLGVSDVLGSVYGSLIYSNSSLVPSGYTSGSNLSFSGNALNLKNSWSAPFTINGNMFCNQFDNGSIQPLLVNGRSSLGSIFQEAVSSGSNSTRVYGTSQFAKINVGPTVSTSFPLNVASSGFSSTIPPTNGFLGLGGLSTNSTSSATASFSSGILVSGQINVTSDIRNKTEIQSIQSSCALEILLELNPVKFDWKDKLNNRNGRISGFIAQDVIKVIPSAVSITKSQFVANINEMSSYQVVLGSGMTRIDYKGTEIKKGSVIRCYVKGLCKDLTVLFLNDTHFLVNDTSTWEISGNVLLYGTEVDDFHHFQPEQLIAMNVGAIQRLNILYSDLHKKIQNFK